MIHTLAETDALTTAAGAATKALERGMSYDSIIFAAIVVVPIMIVVLWVVIWHKGGGREIKDAVVTVIGGMREASVNCREIAEIHERIVNKSPVEYQEVLRQRNPPDRSPSPRHRRDEAPA